MKRVMQLIACLMFVGSLTGCATTGTNAPGKLDAANVGNTSGVPNDDYMYRSPSYQMGRTASPRIGR